MRQRQRQFRIPAAQKAAALAALLPLCDESPVRSMGGYLPPPTSLEDALARYGWRTAIDADGAIVDLYFVGDKYGDLDDELMQVIAPFVDSGSYLIMEREDGYIWRWLFADKNVLVQQGHIVFDNPPALFPSQLEDSDA
jgi:hypothetical protein